MFLEAFVVDRSSAGPRPRTDAESLIKATGVAAGLGTSTAGTWLKLPYGPGYDRVAAATTIPILMLGGEVRDDPVSVLDEFATGMASGPTVRGALVGRNISFAPREDPRALAVAAGAIVHRGVSGAAARALIAGERGRELDHVTRLGPPPGAGRAAAQTRAAGVRDDQLRHHDRGAGGADLGPVAADRRDGRRARV